MRVLPMILVVMILLSTGCATTYRSEAPRPGDVVVTKKHVKKHGPPPHAPAHGYRHKHEGVELRYSSKMKVYEVVDHRDHYYHDGVYFRWTPNGWEMSATLSGDWGTVTIQRVPKGLRKAHK